MFIQTQNLSLDSGSLSSSTVSGRGGNITLAITDNLILNDNSLISAEATNNADGGNVNIDTDFIIAFPNQNNDIIASAEDGVGGNINIRAESQLSIEERPLDPQTNDINASSDFGLDGSISLKVLEVNPLQGTVELSDSLMNTDELVANSCVVPSGGQRGTFIITGAGGLLVRPGDASVSPYPTGTVRTVLNDELSSSSGASRSWQKGDPIVEPQGVYQLENGQLILSRKCT